MAGALTLDKLATIIRDAGFSQVQINYQPVSDPYAQKWGITEVNLKEILYNSMITAVKPEH